MPSPPLKVVPLGDGTITIGDTPFDFSCEVTGASVTHDYEDGEDPVTTLCGQKTAAAGQTRTDGLEFSTLASLESTGLYQYVQSHDLETQKFVFTPNTANGAKWEGSVQLRLPESIGADEYGANIEAEYTWIGMDKFVFTPAVAPTHA
jgi:hypothetical protein